MGESVERFSAHNTDGSLTTLDVRSNPSSGVSTNHALYVVQKGASGLGQAVVVESKNSTKPAVTVQGSGDLLELTDSSGVQRLVVGQGGAFSVGGSGVPEPSDQNLIGWAYDPACVNAGATLLTGGVVYLSKIPVRLRSTATSLYWWITTAGATPTAGQNYVALVDSSGTRLATTDVDSAISSTGLKTTTITSTTLSPGYYYVAFVFNAATTPTVARTSTFTGVGSVMNVGLAASAYRFATNGTGQTSIPASITLSANGATPFTGPWAAIGA